MIIENCDNGKLNASNGRLFSKDLEKRYREESYNFSEIILIPSKASQGYLFKKESDKNKTEQFYRFGLPLEMSGFSNFWIHTGKRTLNECCKTNIAVVIDGDKVDDEEVVWKSVLHIVRNKKEMEEVIKGFFASETITFSFDLQEPVTLDQHSVFKGFLGLGVRAFGTMLLDVWEKTNSNKERETLLVVKNGDKLNYAGKNAVRDRHLDFQETLIGLFYSQKVRDVIGGFEF
jgi:hypothetical protein